MTIKNMKFSKIWNILENQLDLFEKDYGALYFLILIIVFFILACKFQVQYPSEFPSKTIITREENKNTRLEILNENLHMDLKMQLTI